MKNPKITVVEYGAGNTGSVSNAFSRLGYSRVKVTSQPEELLDSQLVVLPGVGCFGECASNLRSRGLEPVLRQAVFDGGIPILGICVGMQLLAECSEESEAHPGLGWIPGSVRKLSPKEGFPVPHVGWNAVHHNDTSTIFSRVPDDSDFYFDHNYAFNCDSKFVLATASYEVDIVAAIRSEHIFGVQFHPEKSHHNGLRLFRGLVEAVTNC